MYIVSSSPSLTSSIISHLAESGAEPVAKFEIFTVLPKQDNVLLAIEDFADINLRPVIRHFIINADSWAKLAVVSREWSEQHLEKLAEIVRAEYRRADQLNQTALDKISSIPDGDWKRDRLEKLKDWKTRPTLPYATFALNENLPSQLEGFFRTVQSFEIVSDNSNIAAKPPVLHWTTMPLEEEWQVILRIQMSISGPDETTFREMCRNIRDNAAHFYEWTEGVLVTADAVRLHVERVNPTVIEIACRVSVEELDDEPKPMRLAWPHLGNALRHVLSALDQQEHLWYSVDVIPFGEAFFSPPLESRVFDLTNFMATFVKMGKVGCRVDEQIYDVRLDDLLPEGPYSSLAALTALEVTSSRSSRSSSVQERADEVSPIEPPQIGGGLTVAHNRGRRVSFGTIKMMNEPAQPVINGVDAFVDGLIQKTMDFQSLYVD